MQHIDRNAKTPPPLQARRILGFAPWLVGSAALTLAACGGSNSPVSADAPAVTAPGTTIPGTTTPGTTPPGAGTPGVAGAAVLSGVAATGAALAGAAVTVTDSAGATVCAVTTLANGSYSCTLPAATAAPLVIRAALGDTVLYGVSAGATTATANVTPLTTILASRLAPDGDPASLAATIRTAPATLTAATLQAQVTALLTALKPVLDLLGTSFDPVSGIFQADGSGQDRVLDAIAVSVRPDGSAANIEISLKSAITGASPDPVSVTFRSDAAIPTLPVTADTRIPTLPTPAILSAFASRLNACFALPLSQRVNAASDTAAVTGTAADLIAAACRTLFVGDDPATYLNSGATVGRDTNNTGAYAGFFRPGATGLVWDRLGVEFVRANGDFVITYRTTTTAGEIDTGTQGVRLVDGALKLSGNNYVYSAGVNPYSEDRESLRMPAYSYNTTGYTVAIPNRLDSSGNTIFSRVEVTTPFGQALTFLPSPGLSNLQIAINGSASGTTIVRQAAAYQNTAMAGDPRTLETGLFYTPTAYSDAELAAVPNLGLWSFRFVHLDATRADVLQSTRTIARAQTLAEIRQTPFVQFLAGTRTELANASPNGYVIFPAPGRTAPNIIDLRADGAPDFWTVPAGALAPTQMSVLGRAPFGSTTANQQGSRFNDGTSFASTARSAIVYCSVASAGDRHCDNSLGFQQYAQGSTFNLIELYGRNARQVILSKKLSLYPLLTP